VKFPPAKPYYYQHHVFYFRERKHRPPSVGDLRVGLRRHHRQLSRPQRPRTAQENPLGRRRVRSPSGRPGVELLDRGDLFPNRLRARNAARRQDHRQGGHQRRLCLLAHRLEPRRYRPRLRPSHVELRDVAGGARRDRGGKFPGREQSHRRVFPKKERALATGLYNSGANVGAIVAPLCVPWIASH
jgi:hypothetical protein